jgi:murein DD-endopeptidase MepM/ murein hydrolase activator NlpD
MHEVESVSLIELLLSNESMANAWVAADSLNQFKTVVIDKVDSLEQSQKELEGIKDVNEEETRRLDAEKDELSSAKLALDINRSAKNKLLKVTKNKEGEYQRLLSAKRRAKKKFESELLAFESRLKYVLDKSKLPTGKGILKWPVAKVWITQYFGNTKFASSGAYNGKGHNGIDLGVVVGTRVNAAAGGRVIEVGNTDAHPGCYSYGKWVLIDHQNGIATLYAHLSKISVSTGQAVAAGQRIAYSGNTGYSTGPHLHFSTFASDAVRVVRMGDVKARTNCKNARVPISPTKGYLNPLNYL